MTIQLTDKQAQLVCDVLEEARAVSQQLIKQVPPSQVARFKKQSTDIKQVLKRFRV